MSISTVIGVFEANDFMIRDGCMWQDRPITEMVFELCGCQSHINIGKASRAMKGPVKTGHIQAGNTVIFQELFH